MSRTPPRRPSRRSTVHPLLGRAVSLHQAGRLTEASKIYEQIIAQVPRHFDATHLLGVIALQEGQLERAHELIASALHINPNDPVALGNLGTAYLRSGELGAAYIQFEHAVRLQPNSSTALMNIGTALRQLGRSREALVPLRRAYTANPKSGALCNLIGACLLDTEDVRAAVKFFEAATDAQPDDPDGWANLSVALNSAGEHGRAHICAAKAIAIRPDSSSALAALAAVQFEEGNGETAIATYRQAVGLPNPSTQTHCAFANALLTNGLFDEGIEHLRQAIAKDGNNAIARWKLAMAQIRPICRDEAEMIESREEFFEQLGGLETWYQAFPSSEAYIAVGANQPFYLAYQPFNNKHILARYGNVCVRWMASMPPDGSIATCSPPVSSDDTGTKRKVRIGIASAHIRDHSVWNAITKGWIRHLDKTRFEVFLFKLGRSSDAETALAKQDAAHFQDQPESLPAWVSAIRAANLDALIYPEIGMDPLTTQLASLRLAPVQAASWGHPETTGLPTIDLYLSADGLEPPDSQVNYSERLVRLPNLGVCVEPLTPSIAYLDLESLGLPIDEPLLLCPGTPFKYTPPYDKVWARIAIGLQTKGGSRILARLKGMRGGSGGRLVFFRTPHRVMNNLLEKRLRNAFDRERVDFDARVCLIPYLGRSQFFALMQRSTIMLDTLGFSGFNTALQAVECGLPVLAREGSFMRGRLASGIMRRMGLHELVANTDESFIQSAIRLAGDPSRCEELRLEISNRRKVLFHDVEPIRALELCLNEAIAQTQHRALAV